MLLADGKGTFDPSIVREGIVGKCNTTSVTFKAVSNKWLMRNDAADTEEAT